MAWPARVATNAAGALPGVAASSATRSAQRRSSSLQLGLAGCAVSNASSSVTSRARRSSIASLGAPRQASARPIRIFWTSLVPS